MEVNRPFHVCHFCRLFTILVFVVSALACVQRPQVEVRRQVRPEDLVITREGDVPILITAPHGGSEEVPGVTDRTGQPGVFVPTDSGTLELAQKCARYFREQTGGQPYLVLARFRRSYIDANRPADEAYDPEDENQARPYYDYYHSQIRRFVDEIRQRWSGFGLLLDVHGQSDDADTIHRGTRNGRTVQRLRNRYGDAALVGPWSIFGSLADAGYTVFPPNVPPDQQNEDPDFNGGHTVWTYGSQRRDGIDAIQVEIGSDFRQQDTLEDMAQDLARALARFYEAYLVHQLTQFKAGARDEAQDRFGQALAMGDFDGDGFDDVAIGVPAADEQDVDTGMVVVFYGGRAGFVQPGEGIPEGLRYHRITMVHVGEAPNRSNHFGAALAAADFNGDGFDDLAVGAPGRDVSAQDAGKVYILYGSVRGLLTRRGARYAAVRSDQLDQRRAGARNERQDRFGGELAAGDFNGDGFADLAVGVPGEDDEARDDGMVVVFYGGREGFLRRPGRGGPSPRFERLGQRQAGVRSEAHDQFGEVLTAGDFNGDGFTDLAVGVPRKDDRAVDAGMVFVFYGSGQGILKRDGKVFRVRHGERLVQEHAGATSEAHDEFGYALARGDFNRDGYDDLAVSVYLEDDAAPDEGMVIVFYGSQRGFLIRTRRSLRARHSERLTQKHAGAQRENGDQFGQALTSGDFNGDGFTDLVVGVPNEDDRRVDDGIVVVFYGHADGLLRQDGDRFRAWKYERIGAVHSGGAPEKTALFGQVLVAGDVDGDHRDDLLVAAPFEDRFNIADVGTVFWLLGTPTGLLRR